MAAAARPRRRLTAAFVLAARCAAVHDARRRPALQPGAPAEATACVAAAKRSGRAPRAALLQRPLDLPPGGEEVCEGGPQPLALLQLQGAWESSAGDLWHITGGCAQEWARVGLQACRSTFADTVSISRTGPRCRRPTAAPGAADPTSPQHLPSRLEVTEGGRRIRRGRWSAEYSGGRPDRLHWLHDALPRFQLQRQLDSSVYWFRVEPGEVPRAEAARAGALRCGVAPEPAAEVLYAVPQGSGGPTLAEGLAEIARDCKDATKAFELSADSVAAGSYFAVRRAGGTVVYSTLNHCVEDGLGPRDQVCWVYFQPGEVQDTKVCDSCGVCANGKMAPAAGTWRLVCNSHGLHLPLYASNAWHAGDRLVLPSCWAPTPEGRKYGATALHVHVPHEPRVLTRSWLIRLSAGLHMLRGRAGACAVSFGALLRDVSVVGADGAEESRIGCDSGIGRYPRISVDVQAGRLALSHVAFEGIALAVDVRRPHGCAAMHGVSLRCRQLDPTVEEHGIRDCTSDWRPEACMCGKLVLHEQAMASLFDTHVTKGALMVLLKFASRFLASQVHITDSMANGLDVSTVSEDSCEATGVHVELQRVRVTNARYGGVSLVSLSESSVSMQEVTVHECAAKGIFLDIRRECQVELADIDANGNGADGIHIDDRSATSTILARRITSSENWHAGLRITSSVEFDHLENLKLQKPRSKLGPRVMLEQVDVLSNTETGLRAHNILALVAKRVRAKGNQGIGVFVGESPGAELLDIESEANSVGISLYGAAFSRKRDVLSAWADGRIRLVDNIIGLQLRHANLEASNAVWYVVKNAVGIHMEQSNDIVIRGIVHFNKAADTDLRGRHGGAVLRRSSAILHAPHNTIFSGICATGGLAALGAILLPLMRSLSIVIADVLLSIAGSLAFWALSILLWYNIALWSSDIYTVACMPLDIIVLAMILISTAMSYGIRFVAKRIVSDARLDAMEKLGHESAQRFIEMSEFKEQRKSVDDVNLAFTESMDMLYAERRDKDMGYDANQIADQDRIVGRVIRGTLPVAPAWALFLAGGPGSGKGTVIRFLKRNGYIPKTAAVIDIDDMRMQLPAYQRISDKVLACRQTQAQAGYMAEIASHWCMQERVSFVLDACLAGLAWHRHLFNFLQSSGMRLGILLVETDVETCLQRVHRREQQTGRPVPEAIVRERNEECRANAFALRSDVQLFVRVRNERSPTFQDKRDDARLRSFVKTVLARSVSSFEEHPEEQAAT